MEDEEDAKLPEQLHDMACWDGRLLGSHPGFPTFSSAAPRQLCPCTDITSNENGQVKIQLHPIPRCPQTPMGPHCPASKTDSSLLAPCCVPARVGKTAFQPKETTHAGDQEMTPNVKTVSNARHCPSFLWVRNPARLSQMPFFRVW